MRCARRSRVFGAVCTAQLTIARDIDFPHPLFLRDGCPVSSSPAVGIYS